MAANLAELRRFLTLRMMITKNILYKISYNYKLNQLT